MSSRELRKLEVRLELAPGEAQIVGTLAESRGRIVFEYDAEFLRDPLWLSPFHLPPEPGLYEHRDRDFGPLFGLFDDSLPDGWGLLLMDRHLEQQGFRRAEISPLDRLAYLGRRTMGALTYHPPTGEPDAAPATLDLQEMAAASRQVLAGTASEVLPQLLRAGGSPGGARPKVLVGVRGDDLISGEGDLPAGSRPFLVKFFGRDDPPDSGAVEMAYSHMARAAGISMPATRLFETRGGERFFGVERFDRDWERRIHVHTFGNLIHQNFRIPGCDYRQFLEITRLLTRNHSEAREAYRRMVFNVLAHNRDDHVKNFAFRLDGGDPDSDSAWQLTPAYDLVYADGPGGEHTMTVAGEGRLPERRHLLALAEAADLMVSEAASVLDDVAAAVDRWPEHAREAGVSPERRRAIGAALEDCVSRSAGKISRVPR